MPSRSGGGGPRIFFFGALKRDAFVGGKGDFDVSNVVGLEGEEFGLGPIFRFEVEVSGEWSEVGFGFGVEAEEAAAGLGGFAESERRECLGGGIEDGDVRVLELEAGDAVRVGGD